MDFIATKVMSFLWVFIFLWYSTSAAPQFSAQRTFSNELPEPYQYEYKVENPPTNTFFGKNEAGDSAGRVSGSYYVYLPDGRVMTVDYSVAGDSGFVPKINFSNQPGSYRATIPGLG